MRNIKLTIEYDGTNYAGWQTQSSSQLTVNSSQKNTVQETIERTLQKILQEKIRLIASGRTDAGVHAKAQVANFKTSSSLKPEKLQRALNALLPSDIIITKANEVNLDFHSRFSAKSKLYRYTLLNRLYHSAFLKNRVYFYPYPLNIKLMRDESKVLLGRHNFASFRATGSARRDSIRTIKKIKITQAVDLIHLDIEANGFLYNMVRNIVGTLIEIGRGRFKRGSLKKILLSYNRKIAGPTAPACGLYLIKVRY